MFAHLDVDVTPSIGVSPQSDDSSSVPIEDFSPEENLDDNFLNSPAPRKASKEQRFDYSDDDRLVYFLLLFESRLILSRFTQRLVSFFAVWTNLQFYKNQNYVSAVSTSSKTTNSRTTGTQKFSKCNGVTIIYL